MVGTPEALEGLITKRGLPAGKEQIRYEVDGYQNRHESGKDRRINQNCQNEMISQCFSEMAIKK